MQTILGSKVTSSLYLLAYTLVGAWSRSVALGIIRVLILVFVGETIRYYVKRWVAENGSPLTYIVKKYFTPVKPKTAILAIAILVLVIFLSAIFFLPKTEKVPGTLPDPSYNDVNNELGNIDEELKLQSPKPDSTFNDALIELRK